MLRVGWFGAAGFAAARGLAVVLGIVTAIVTGCSQNYSDKQVPEALAEKGLSRPNEAIHGGTPHCPDARLDLGGVSARVPGGWERVEPASAMRRVEFRLPGVQDAGGAILAVYYFGAGKGGSVDANISRWVGQFSGAAEALAPRVQKMRTEAGGMPVTVLDVSGTYDDGTMTTAHPLPGYRMLAAVVEAPAGPFFFKLVGPEPTVARWARSFREFLNTLQPEPAPAAEIRNREGENQ